MAAYNKINDFVLQLAKGVHHLHGAGDVVKAMLTNAAPVATNTIKSDLTEITAQFGYTAGGTDIQNDCSQAAGTLTATATDVVWTASGGSFGPLRYVSTYNDTATSPVDPLINWWDYGSSPTIADTETFTLDFGASWFTLA